MDYYELNDRAGLNISTEEYETIRIQYIDSRREVKELKDELAKAKELGEMFAKEKEAKDAEIAKLNALLDAYRKVVDLSRFTQDEMVIALANGGVRL